MKNKFSTLLLFIFFISFISVHNTSAQQYDYSRFRFPDVKVKGLNSTVNLNGNMFDYKNKPLDFNTGSINYSINRGVIFVYKYQCATKTDRVYFNHSFDYDKYFPNAII
ncbi:MAG: hypothetical protein IPJ51_19950 [Saprospiraceae bacterium]|nr:hypothetical protein [Saprospiraceae bacterium]